MKQEQKELEVKNVPLVDRILFSAKILSEAILTSDPKKDGLRIRNLLTTLSMKFNIPRRHIDRIVDATYGVNRGFTGTEALFVGRAIRVKLTKTMKGESKT